MRLEINGKRLGVGLSSKCGLNIIKKFLRESKRIQKDPKGSKRIQKDPEDPKGSRGSKRIRKDLQDPKESKGSEDPGSAFSP